MSVQKTLPTLKDLPVNRLCGWALAHMGCTQAAGRIQGTYACGADLERHESCQFRDDIRGSTHISSGLLAPEPGAPNDVG